MAVEGVPDGRVWTRPLVGVSEGLIGGYAWRLWGRMAEGRQSAEWDGLGIETYDAQYCDMLPFTLSFYCAVAFLSCTCAALFPIVH